MSDVRVEQKQVLSRQEAARFIAELAEGLGDDGMVTVRLGSSTLELSVPDELRCELEVAVDGDGIELELELKWSTSGRASAAATEDESEEPEEPCTEEEPAEDQPEEDEPEEDEPEEDEGALDASADAESAEGEPEAAAGSGGADSEQSASPDRSVPAAPRRRRASARADKPAVNGVDTAAVRAWAAASGLTVPSRGRIKDEVIKAYRAAGN